MRPFAIFVLIAAVLSAPAVGQLPDPAPLSWSITVDSPGTGQPGRFVELTCVSDGAAEIRWRIVGAEDDLIRVVDSGRRCLFVSPMPGEFRLVCAASRSDGALDLVETVVRIEGSRPTPGPGPVPTPTPMPGPQPGPSRFGLAQKCWALASPLTAAHAPLLRTLAGNYSSVAAQGAAISTATIESMRADVTARNREAAGSSRDSLMQPLFVPLGAAVAEAEKNGQVRSKNDVIELFYEIATGLRAAAGGN